MVESGSCQFELGSSKHLVESVCLYICRMDAIKKKMQAMKLEKDNAMDRADACEQQAKDANLRAERVNILYERDRKREENRERERKIKRCSLYNEHLQGLL